MCRRRPGSKGPNSLPAILGALEGFEAPAKAWETEILPARLKGYQASWLDAQCLAGRTAWARLTPPAGGNGRARHATPIGATPIALIERRRAPLWMALAPLSGAAPLSGRAEAVLDCLSARGAMFFDELADSARLLRHELEEALGELVALGLAASDSFGGLRALLVPSGQRKPPAGAKRRGRVLAFDIESGGRWSRIGRARESGGVESRAEAIEYAARTLLRRYGVVFWRLLAQEPGWLPPWRDLLRVYRRLEARGEIRGGRFVAGFSGEQFALPDAIGLMREIRRRPARRPVGFALRRRSAQPDRHPDAGTKALGADRQSRRLPRRPAGRRARRRQSPVPDRPRDHRPMGGRETPGPIGGARHARRPRLNLASRRFTGQRLDLRSSERKFKI